MNVFKIILFPFMILSMIIGMVFLSVGFLFTGFVDWYYKEL
jgi:hypothetical protein